MNAFSLGHKNNELVVYTVSFISVFHFKRHKSEKGASFIIGKKLQIGQASPLHAVENGITETHLVYFGTWSRPH